ncbi:MAG: MBL fold metallo-hydrolase, partial [Bacteroidota bacterium]
SYSLTQSKDVLLVPTPGHTHGHQSVILRVGQYNIVFAGDASFTQAQIMRKKVAGICADKKVARKTIEKIQCFAQEHPMIYLPSHDLESTKRLLNLEVYE